MDHLHVDHLHYMWIMFTFVRNHKTVFQSGCIILHSHQQQIRVPVAHIFFGIVSVPDFSYSNRCIVISHCFNLHSDDMMWSIFSYVYLPSVYLFVDEASIKVFGTFLIGLFVFLLNFKTSLYILDNSPLSHVCFANIYSQLVACLHILLILSFAEQKLLILLKSSLSIISFMDCAFVVVSKKSSPYPRSSMFAPRLSSRSFIALCFTFIGLVKKIVRVFL